MKNPTIWVVGDSMLDISVRRDRYSVAAESPVPVLPAIDLLQTYAPADGVAFHCGAAANVAANLTALGCRVRLFSRLGGGDARDGGVELRTLLWRAGVRCGENGNDSDTAAMSPITIKTRYYAGNRLLARIDRDRKYALGGVLPPQACAAAEHPDAIVITDHHKGDVSAESLRAWVDWAYERGIPVYGDPKLGATAIWQKLHHICLVANLAEAGEMLAYTASVDGMAYELVARFRFRAAIVKAGAEGSAWAHHETAVAAKVAAVDPQQIFDVQGAGDSYLAGLVAARCRGADWNDACRYASATAGVAVGQLGTAVVSSSQVVEVLKPVCGQARGVLTYREALELAQMLARYKFRIGLTNGCFDLVIPHTGHIATIQEAAQRSDFLFVAVDSDARVSTLKGPERPYNPALDRVTSVAALRGVGAAFIFDRSMDEVVADFRPNLLFKGGDYADKEVPEARFLSEWGGALVLTPLVATASTTQRHGG